MTYNQARVRRVNDRPLARTGAYVLYWMQAFRRLHHNHALDYALTCARELGRPPDDVAADLTAPDGATPDAEADASDTAPGEDVVAPDLPPPPPRDRATSQVPQAQRDDPRGPARA